MVTDRYSLRPDYQPGRVFIFAVFSYNQYTAMMAVTQDCYELLLTQRIDYENYSAALDPQWLDDDTLTFQAGLQFNGGEFSREAVVRYRCAARELTYEPQP